jgi:hypothetical protein
MQNMIKADFIIRGQIKSDNFPIDEYPDTCPICHQGIEPAYRSAWMDEDHLIFAILKCPKKKCGSLFVSAFVREIGEGAASPTSSVYNLKGSFPKNPKEHEFPPEIKRISKNFCAIYTESEAAEQRGMINICGAGYRKALEFLIKDYLIGSKQIDAGAVRKTPLANCIKDYVDEGNIKDCAERAAWLGNDETHYYRTWEDKDLSDLKNLIKLTVAWMHLVSVTKEAIDAMPRKAKA